MGRAYCKTCGREARADTAFCTACGAALFATCQSCGGRNKLSDRFCGQCGVSLPSQNGSMQPAKGDTKPVDDASQSGVPIYFPISLTKLALLSIFSFGLYEIYWFGENWRLEAKRTGENIRPAMRAVFPFFFCKPLLDRIKRYANHIDVGASYPPSLLTIAYIVLLVAPAGSQWWFLSTLSFLPLVPAQIVINRINEREAPAADRNVRFSVGNWVVVVLGALIDSLALLGMMSRR